MDSQEALANLKKQMKESADKLEFEEAARLRDEILKIESKCKGGNQEFMKLVFR